MSDKYNALGNGDLTPEQLDGMELWDRDVMFDERHRAVGSMLVRRAVTEIRRRRAGAILCDDLPWYLKGYLPAQRHANFERHLESCAKCQAASAPHVNAEIATIGPLMTQADPRIAALKSELAASEEQRDVYRDRAQQLAGRVAEMESAARPCPTCGKPGHLPQDHAGWDPSKDMP